MRRAGSDECPLPGIWQSASPNEHVAGMTHDGEVGDLELVPIMHHGDKSATASQGGPQADGFDCS